MSESFKYAQVELSGLTHAYKKRFLKMVENSRAYYMPSLSGMCDGPYYETEADHHVYIRVKDMDIFSRILDVLGRRYKCQPQIDPVKPTDIVYGRDNKTYEMLNYETSDYVGREFYPGIDIQDA